MASTTIHLVRHGEVDNPEHVVYASLPGFGLSRRGREQAQAAAAHLDATELTALYTSPLQRAVETSEVLAASLGVRVQTETRLREWDLGERWAGVGWESLAARFPGEVEAYLAHPHDLDFTPEPLSDLARRVGRFLEEVAESYAGGTVVAVSHQDPIQAGRLSLTQRNLETLQDGKPGHGSIVSLVHTAGHGWVETAYWEPDQGVPFPPVTDTHT